MSAYSHAVPKQIPPYYPKGTGTLGYSADWDSCGVITNKMKRDLGMGRFHSSDEMAQPDGAIPRSYLIPAAELVAERVHVQHVQLGSPGRLEMLGNR